MFRIIFFAIVLIFIVGGCGIGFYLGKNVPFAQQWPLYEALRNTASIIFAVVGAWLAIIYPERLKISFGRDRSNTISPNGAGMGLLLTPAVHSTILLVVLLLIGIAAPLLKQLPQATTHVEVFRGLSFAVLVALTCWQACIVIMTLFPAEIVLSASQREQAANQIKSRFGKLRQ
jgi:hypothetical protein